MRRCVKRNSDLQLRVSSAEPSKESLELFQRYLSMRHAGGETPTPTLEDFAQFLLSSWCETLFLEWRSATGELIAVAVTDRLEGALSAVYTYFAPECAARSLGTNAVLQQVALARKQRMQWLYLGYWVEDCRKMSYKCRFRPHQVLHPAGWHNVD
jgi:arginine-tRNA-protein transferase